MDENHKNGKLVSTDDRTWVLSKKSNLLIPQYKKQRRKFFKDKVPFDWLNLIGVFLIPFMIAGGTLYITQKITFQQTQISQEQHQVDTRNAKEQHQIDTQNAQDQQKETELESYISNMQNLLLNYYLPGYASRLARG